MSSVQNEILRDILEPLDRWTIDGAQFVNRRFLLITTGMSNVCLRKVHHASVGGLTKHTDGTTDVGSFIHFADRPERNISKYDEDAAHLFSQLLELLRGCHVATLVIGWMDLTPELAALVLQTTPITVHKLKFTDASCTKLTPAQFQEVILHFSPTLLDVGSRLLRSQLTNDFIRELSKNTSRMSFGFGAPADGGSFHVTDNAVVDFCARQDVRIDEAGDHTSEWKPYEELVLYHGSFTKDLFERLVEASTASTRTQTLRIFLSPIPQFKDEDLQGFAQHLSHRKSDRWGDVRVYDFPDQEDGMHLQIKLDLEPSIPNWNPADYPGKSLALVRARRPNRFFYQTQ